MKILIIRAKKVIISALPQYSDLISYLLWNFWYNENYIWYKFMYIYIQMYLFSFVVYFTTASVYRLHGIQWWDVQWLGKGFGRKQIWLDCGNILAFAWRDWGKPWKTSVSRAEVSAEIQTECLLNASLQHYCYMNTLGACICWNSNSRSMNTWPVIQSCIQLHHKMNKMLSELFTSDKNWTFRIEKFMLLLERERDNMSVH